MAIIESVQEGLGKAITDLIERFYGAGVAKAGFLKGVAQLTFINGFADYVSKTAIRCGSVKTIISRSAPVKLKDVHVPLQFEINSEELDEKKLLAHVQLGNQALIFGLAGCGKSMTMKSCFMELISSGNSIPVYIELRHVVSDTENSLLEHIAEQIGHFTGGFSAEAVEFGVKNELLTLILDGFDEIDRGRRERMEEQINDLVHRCPTARILVSGRPDERYEEWPSFTVAKVLGLSKDQAMEVIEKVEFDDELKGQFLARLDEDLFESHQDILSNPLLCCMMLLTFNEFAEIPSKMHVFYKTAFDVLIRKHDSLKPKFRRNFESGLESYDFTKLFETFCFLSYSDGNYSFDAEQISNSSLEALGYEGLDISPDKFINDLVSNVCVILRDGDQYSFLHRSFQEYFVASFILSRNLENFYDLMTEVIRPDMHQGPYQFMLDMNKEVVIRRYIPIVAREILSKISKAKNDVEAAKLICSGFHVYEDGSLNIYWSSSMQLAKRFYTIGQTVGNWSFVSSVIGPDLVAKFASESEYHVDGPEEDDRPYLDIDADTDGFAEIVKESGFCDEFRSSLDAFIKYAEDLDNNRKAALARKIRPKPHRTKLG